jgi:hypothetical protein
MLDPRQRKARNGGGLCSAAWMERASMPIVPASPSESMTGQGGWSLVAQRKGVVRPLPRQQASSGWGRMADASVRGETGYCRVVVLTEVSGGGDV